MDQEQRIANIEQQITSFQMDNLRALTAIHTTLVGLLGSIATERLNIIDPHGRIVASLGCSETNNGELTICDSNGMPLCLIGVEGEVGVICTRSRAGAMAALRPPASTDEPQAI